MGPRGLPTWIVGTTLGFVIATAVAGWLTLAILLHVVAGTEDRQNERLDRIGNTQETIVEELRRPSGEQSIPERAETYRSVRRTEVMIERLCDVTAGCDPPDR